MKTNNPIKALTAALLLVTAPPGAQSASVLADGNFDSLPVGTAPDIDTPAGHWYFPADLGSFREGAASQFSIAPAPAGSTGNALRVSFAAGEHPGLNAHIPNILARPVTAASGKILYVSFDIYVEPGATGPDIYLGRGYNPLERGPLLEWVPGGSLVAFIGGSGFTLVPSYPKGVWQTVRLELDVARARFNFYWSEKGQSVSVTHTNVAFESGAIQYIDRFAVVRFSDFAASDMRAYVDNIQVSAGEPAAVKPGQSFVAPGGSVTLSLTNAPDVPSTYQWQFNGTNLPGATSSTLALSNLAPDQSGPYSITISNEYEFVTTAPAAVQVVTSVTISSQPRSTNVLPGASATLRVTAVSPLLISYQWQFNGTNIAGAIDAALTLTNLQFDSHTGYYRVLVSDTASNIWSDTATLIVLAPPTVTSQPVAQTVLQGGTAVFSVRATPDHPLLPLNYRWVRQGTTFLSNAPPTLVITNVQPGLAGAFRATITNLAGLVNSATVNLTVLPDFDRDGMADAWEKLYGFDTNNLADAGLDRDGDGMINRDEYAAGTNPTNSASVLKLQLASQAGGQYTLTFLAVSNQTYSVEWNTQVTGDTWSNLVHVLAQSTNRTEGVTDTNAGGPTRFYRVVTPRRP